LPHVHASPDQAMSELDTLELLIGMS
jgi:hypothetical protein